MGIGHVPGMVENWGKVTTEQVRIARMGNL